MFSLSVDCFIVLAYGHQIFKNFFSELCIYTLQISISRQTTSNKVYKCHIGRYIYIVKGKKRKKGKDKEDMHDWVLDSLPSFNEICDIIEARLDFVLLFMEVLIPNLCIVAREKL